MIQKKVCFYEKTRVNYKKLNAATRKLEKTLENRGFTQKSRVNSRTQVSFFQKYIG